MFSIYVLGEIVIYLSTAPFYFFILFICCKTLTIPLFTVRVDVTRSLSIVISHQRLHFFSKGVSSLHQEDSAAERRMLALLTGMLLKFI